MIKNKKDIFYISAIILLAGAAGQSYYSYKYEPAHQIAVYYNQDHALNDEIVNLIRDADHFVYFSVYTFTRGDIESALLAAKRRGLNVVGLTDRDQYQQLPLQKKLVDELRNAGIPVYTQDHLGIMHTKVVVTDKAYASGSYNWTAAATNLNDEVLEVGSDANIRQSFESILLEMFKKYQGSA